MLVGITFDLKSDYLEMGFSKEAAAEFDTIETIDGIDNALQSLGYKTDRIGHVKNLISQIEKGKRWDIVFNICEGVKGSGREAQVPAVLDIYDIPYTFSDVLVMSLTLNKALTKHVVMNAGFTTPAFNILQNIDEINRINLPFPLFVKPALEGSGKGIDDSSFVQNRQQLHDTCAKKCKAGYAPLLIEKYLSGREFTAGIVGTGKEAKLLGVMEVKYNDKNNEVYSYETKTNYEDFVKYALPENEIVEACEKMVLGIWNLLNCKDAGRIDLRMDENGIINFIEINPLAGLNLIHSDLPIIGYLNGLTYSELINEIMTSAIKRYNL